MIIQWYANVQNKLINHLFLHRFYINFIADYQ